MRGHPPELTCVEPPGVVDVDSGSNSVQLQRHMVDDEAAPLFVEGEVNPTHLIGLHGVADLYVRHLIVPLAFKVEVAHRLVLLDCVVGSTTKWSVTN